MMSCQYPKRSRLLRSSEFKQVFAAKAKISNPWIVLFGAGNELSHPRLGLVVSRRIGNAVVRNRWKRLIREAFRQQQNQLPALDLVCIVRAQTPPPLGQLRKVLAKTTKGIERKLQDKSRQAARKTP